MICLFAVPALALQKNVASQKIGVFAYDDTTGDAKTGNAAQITAYIWQDWASGAASNDANPTELDATNAPGIYVFDLTQGETNADVVALYALSATADIVLRPVVVHTTPPNFPDTALSVLTTSDNIGINWGDVSNPTTSVGLSNTTVGTTTLNSDMVGEPATALSDVNLDHLVKSAVDTNLQTTVHDNSVLGYMLASVNVSAYVRTTDSFEDLGENIADIETDTAVIGALGAGLTGIPWNSAWDTEVESEVDDALGGGTGTALTALPWNSAWDAEVQSEAADAIVVYKLDHLVYAADGDDPVDNSIIAKLAATGGDWSTFVPGTESQQALRDQGDVAWTTGGGTGLTALATGTAQSGTASTIVLASASTFADNVLNGSVIKIHTGTGAGQHRVITTNTLTDDTCNIAPNWIVNPSSDSQYEIVDGTVNITDASWQELIELMFSFNATGAYGDQVGSLVDVIVDNASTEVWDEVVRTLTANTNLSGLEVDVTKFHGSALTETAGGRLAAAFVKLFDVATPLLVASDVMRGTDSAALASAYTATRAGYLDQLNAGGTLYDNIVAIKALWDSLTITGGLLEIDMKKLDGTAVKSTNGNIHALPGNIF